MCSVLTSVLKIKVNAFSVKKHIHNKRTLGSSPHGSPQLNLLSSPPLGTGIHGDPRRVGKAKVSAAAASSAAVLGRLAVWCGQHRKHRHLPIIPPTFPRITNKQETTLLPGIQLHSSTGGLYSKPFYKSLGGFYELLAGTTTMSILKELDLTRNSRRYSAEQRKG